MRAYVGTSGYSYAPWKGIFYPEKMPAAKMLGYYATRLPAVEINNTFYRMPKRELLEGWAADVPETFQFALKSPRRITHDKRLADAEDAVRQLCEAADVLGPRLGPVLFQLPPFQRKDLPRLEAFLATLKAMGPSAVRAAFEFRHASWFSDDVYAALRAGGAALCIAEAEDLATPFEATADWGYLRLRRQDYGPPEIAAWAERLANRGWNEFHLFFKHEDDGKGPALAEQLLDRLGVPRPAPAPEAQK